MVREQDVIIRTQRTAATYSRDPVDILDLYRGMWFDARYNLRVRPHICAHVKDGPHSVDRQYTFEC